MTESEPQRKSVPPEIIGEYLSLGEAFELLWPGKKTIIACGHAVVGEEGFQVKVANILKMGEDDETILGWAYQHMLSPDHPGNYEHEGFWRVEGKEAGPIRLPDTLFVWISEIDESMAIESSENRAREIMDWA